MCWAGSARQPRSVCDLRHLLFQLGNALVLVGDGVFYGFQLFQNLIQFGFVLLEGKTQHIFVMRWQDLVLQNSVVKAKGLLWMGALQGSSMLNSHCGIIKVRKDL